MWPNVCGHPWFGSVLQITNAVVDEWEEIPAAMCQNQLGNTFKSHVGVHILLAIKGYFSKEPQLHRKSFLIVVLLGFLFT